MSSEGPGQMMPSGSKGSTDNGPLESESLANEMLCEGFGEDGLPFCICISSFFFVGKELKKLMSLGTLVSDSFSFSSCWRLILAADGMMIS